MNTAMLSLLNNASILRDATQMPAGCVPRQPPPQRQPPPGYGGCQPRQPPPQNQGCAPRQPPPQNQGCGCGPSGDNQAMSGQAGAILAALGGGGGQWNRPAFTAAAFPNTQQGFIDESGRGGDVIYGFDSGTTIAAATTATLTVAPQKRHTPKRIALSSAIASAFLMSDFRVGVEPILSTVGNINMAIFIQDSTAPSFRAVVCEVGMDVSITVTNISSSSATRFVATVLGTYLPTSQGW